MSRMSTVSSWCCSTKGPYRAERSTTSPELEGDGDTGSARSTGRSTFSLNASRRMPPRVHVGSEAASVRLCYDRDT